MSQRKSEVTRLFIEEAWRWVFFFLICWQPIKLSLLMPFPYQKKLIFWISQFIIFQNFPEEWGTVGQSNLIKSRMKFFRIVEWDFWARFWLAFKQWLSDGQPKIQALFTSNPNTFEWNFFYCLFTEISFYSQFTTWLILHLKMFWSLDIYLKHQFCIKKQPKNIKPW